MITRVFLAPRRDGMTTEACLAHWRAEHSGIGARLPGVRCYVQNHGVLENGRFLLPYPGFDIMPELDWDDLAAMDAAIDSPVHTTESIGDEERFIDTSRTGLAVTERRILSDSAGGPPGAEAVKLISLLRTAPGASGEALARAVIGPYSAVVDEARPLRHEVLVTIPDRPERPAFTCQLIDMVWFATVAHAIAYAASEIAYRAAWMISGLAFGTERLIARPHRVV